MSSGPLQNIYYERKVATPRPCYICRRETSTVLATIKTEDFLYTCDGHLTDPASPIAPPAPSGPSPEDIRKVISDYEARQAKKKDNEKDKEKGEKDAGKKPDDGEKIKSPSSTPASPSSTSATAAAPSHKKYALHRQIWDMRRAEHKRKDQSSKAKEVGKGLPQVPRGNF